MSGIVCWASFLSPTYRAAFGNWLTGGDQTSLQTGQVIRAQGSVLRELHALLKEKDPRNSFGGLVRVQNKI